MQPKTAAPRDHLTEGQVDELLRGDQVTIEAGCELLGDSNQVIEDITDDLVEDGSFVSWDNRDTLHGSCTLNLRRALDWGRDRVRPYTVHSQNGASARFNLGVFILTRPDENRGEDPVTYSAQGFDLLDRMQATGPADTYVVEAGTTYFDAAQAVVAASGIGVQLLLDSGAQAKVVPATRVWVLIPQPPSWLRILTDLLGEIAYDPPWADPDGNIRSRPHQETAARAPEWDLDTGNVHTNIVAPERNVALETGEVANSWRFVRSNAEVTPIEGGGIYTPPVNQSDGPNSIDALGIVVPKIVFVEAADQASLVAEGDRIVAADKASARTISLSINPLPLMGAHDVFTFTDAGDTEKIAAASWTLNLDGSNGALQLGGAPPLPTAKVDERLKATVTSAASLRVVVDGATVDSFANALDAAVYAIGDRVTVTARNPVPPLVQGVES